MNFSDLGVAQKKLLYLLFLLMFYTEPISAHFLHFYVTAVISNLFYAAYVAFLLHFWLFLLDSIVSKDAHKQPLKVQAPKLALIISIFFSISLLKIYISLITLSNPTYFSSNTPSLPFRVISWLLILQMAIYSFYLLGIFIKAIKIFNYMVPNFKLMLSFTVMTIWIACSLLVLDDSWTGLSLEAYLEPESKAFFSVSSGLYRSLSLEALICLYVILVSYLYSPYEVKRVSRKEKMEMKESIEVK